VDIKLAEHLHEPQALKGIQAIKLEELWHIGCDVAVHSTRHDVSWCDRMSSSKLQTVVGWL
jgi:hypothetical protein